MSILAHQIDELVEDLGARQSVLVAFSGGVDSGVVAWIAQRALGDAALAVTAAAETLAGRELDHARGLATEIGIGHQIVNHSELDNAEFVANPQHRCYVCQGMRMGSMIELARDNNCATVCDGTNSSDAASERPGLRAVRELGVYSPLRAHGIGKDTTRQIAKAVGLSVWDRPANACLSSRIPHGQVVTLGKLRRVEAAEDLLAELGFELVRVRHADGSARVEVGREEVSRLSLLWSEVAPQIAALGFREVALDPSGYRAGGADRGATL